MNMHNFGSPAKTLSRYGRVLQATAMVWLLVFGSDTSARAAELPYDFLKHVSQRMTNEIREVGGVVYRISDKPPVTIEWG